MSPSPISTFTPSSHVSPEPQPRALLTPLLLCRPACHNSPVVIRSCLGVRGPVTMGKRSQWMHSIPCILPWSVDLARAAGESVHPHPHPPAPPCPTGLKPPTVPLRTHCALCSVTLPLVCRPACHNSPVEIRSCLGVRGPVTMAGRAERLHSSPGSGTGSWGVTRRLHN